MCSDTRTGVRTLEIIACCDGKISMGYAPGVSSYCIRTLGGAVCAVWTSGVNTLGGALVFGTLGSALSAVGVVICVFSGGGSVAREKISARWRRADTFSSAMGGKVLLGEDVGGWWLVAQPNL